MNKIKKIIIILMIIIVIIIITILILINNEGGLFKMEAEDEDLILYSENAVKKVTSDTDFYTVSNCVQQYLDLVNDRSIYMSEEEFLEIYNDSLYNILSKEYIDKNNIQINNIDKYIDEITEKVIYVPLSINAMQQNKNLVTYIAYGFIQDINSNYKRELYTIINLDSLNSTFSVEPILDNNIKEIKIEKYQQGEILKNEDNEFKYQRINAEYLSSQYLNIYKKTILARPDIAYEHLEKEYRDAKFNNIEEFKQYIDNNRNGINSARLEKYSVIRYIDYIEYICIDQNNKYYIFRQDKDNNYTVMLDNYTVDIAQFTEQYNNANYEVRCSLNIEKIRQALNNMDYKYIYNKLADNFKEQYFKNQSSFEQYVKSNFFRNNIMSYSKVDIQNNNYIFTVLITDADNIEKNAIEKTIVVQLKEGTDFVFSFSV